MKEFLFNQDVGDKYLPKTIYKKGNTYSFEDKRAEELLKAGVGEIVGKVEAPKAINEVVIETAEADKSNVEVATPKRKKAVKAK